MRAGFLRLDDGCLSYISVAYPAIRRELANAGYFALLNRLEGHSLRIFVGVLRIPAIGWRKIRNRRQGITFDVMLNAVSGCKSRIITLSLICARSKTRVFVRYTVKM